MSTGWQVHARLPRHQLSHRPTHTSMHTVPKQSHLNLRPDLCCHTDAPDLPRSTNMTACMYSFTRGGVLRVTLHR